MGNLYIGNICSALDASNVKYHHCRTWFRLFLKNETYYVSSINDEHFGKGFDCPDMVIVYKGDNLSRCENSNGTVVFQGTLDDFKNWLQKNRS